MENKFCSACYARVRAEVRYCTACGERQFEELHIGAKLTILTKDQNSVEFSLDEGKTTIGRHINNTISVNDEHASSYHAVITVDHENAGIEDLNSRNGVYVNGQKIKKYSELKSGSLIKIGATIMKYTPQQELMERAN